MIRVLTVASTAFADGELRGLLRAEPSFEVIDCPFDPQAIEDAIAQTRPDVVLAEIESRDDEGTAALLDAAGNGVPVILIVLSPLVDWADTFALGVRAVLPGRIGFPQVNAAIHAAAAGLGVFYPSERVPLMPEVMPEALVEALTPREIEVLRLLAEGLGNKEIALRLKISGHTVKFHVASVMGKLGAQSRTEAVTLGIRRGMVPI